ncbi:hypothetical protein N7532_006831 [Penicillium argentinense]|uniref:COP9 signalosome complex subunit 6 n=1 Tax=Penicillium argentinense TaxID=1131581 RepID=A0A9W9FGK2_9EURO|nr:uncharacterized protein N7532_006831 [Penicillium argentinense]KAJ5099830.1 hypothetical protein N7532_006831 [Penicillium argentinense]
MDPPQSLVSQKPSDSGIHVQVHPLVLLTISDQITRFAARQRKVEGSTIIGVLLGQQNGRQITIDHAFECDVPRGDDTEVLLPEPWFEERVKQFKDVHKAPSVDLVGWWSIMPPTGPSTVHLPLHRQLLQTHNENAVFLGFQTTQVNSDSRTAKLPLAIYESVLEGENAADAPKDMQIDGEERNMSLRFRELPYAVDTGEAEIIGVDTIAKGSGTASHDEMRTQKSNLSTGNEENASVGLSQDEEELVGSLNTRINAVRTFQDRISNIKDYLISIERGDVPPSHHILRSINSLMSQLSILAPDEGGSFASEVLAQQNDVELAALLGRMGENIKEIREMGRRSATIQSARQTEQARAHMGPGNTSGDLTGELFRQDMPRGRG